MLEAHRDMENERLNNLAARQRGVCKRMLDKNVRLMAAGFNKLLEEWRVHQQELRNKMKFVLKALTDTDANYRLQAYNQLKRNWAALNSGFDFKSQALKENFIKRLMNKGYNLMQMAMNSFHEFMKYQKILDDKKRGICKRMANDSIRMLGAAFRMLRAHARDDFDEQERRANRQRGICRRMLDVNLRLMGMAMVALVDHWQIRNEAAKAKLRSIIDCLRNQQLQFATMAYNQLK